MYVAFNVAGPGLKLPAPPLHSALVAEPPTQPARCTWGEAAHVIWSGPAFTVAPGRMKIVMASFACGQGPPEGALVSVSVTEPAAISAALGVYVALSVPGPGLKAPVPPLQVAFVAEPPSEPASCACGLLAHTIWSGPAFTTAAGLMVIFTWALTGPHGPAGSLVVSVSVALPAAISTAVGV